MCVCIDLFNILINGLPFACLLACKQPMIPFMGLFMFLCWSKVPFMPTWWSRRSWVVSVSVHIINNVHCNQSLHSRYSYTSSSASRNIALHSFVMRRTPPILILTLRWYWSFLGFKADDLHHFATKLGGLCKEINNSFLGTYLLQNLYLC
jgi:hypothetical protein